MNLRIETIFVILLSVLLLSSCKNKKNEQKVESSKFILEGEIKGLGNTKISIIDYSKPKEKAKIVEVVNDKFSMQGNYKEPTLLSLQIEGLEMPLSFYAENIKTTIKGDFNNIKNLQIEGGEVQKGYNIYSREVAKFRSEILKMQASLKKEDLTPEKLKKIQTETMQRYSNIVKDFIKKYPQNSYSAILITQRFSGKSVIQIQNELKDINPIIRKNPILINYINKLKEQAKTEISIEKLMENTPSVSYKVDKTFKGEKLGNGIYLAHLKDNSICLLKENNTLDIISKDAQVVKTIKISSNNKARVVAVDNKDQLYVMCIEKKEIIKKIRGKEHKKMVYEGVECKVLNIEGKELKSFKLKGLKYASGVKIKEDKLVVADFTSGKLAIYNKNTTKLLSQMEGMRPCCGILDFSINAKNEILVGNLGAFRVDGFNLDGKKILSFGQRGKGMNDFHGCCNPVAVSSTSKGAIVTVEKDPTRIKVYSKGGAKTISGIEELVKGCAYIPMTVDANDNIYLASKEKGIVKCVIK